MRIVYSSFSTRCFLRVLCVKVPPHERHENLLKCVLFARGLSERSGMHCFSFAAPSGDGEGG